MGAELHAVKGEAQHGRKHIVVGDQPALAQEPCGNGNGQVGGEQQAQNTSRQNADVSKIGKVADADFPCNGVGKDSPQAQGYTSCNLVDGEHHGVLCPAQQELHIEVLDVAALEVVHDAGTGGKHRQDDVVLIGEQGPHLVHQGDAVLFGKAHLHRHVFRNPLPGVKVLQQQQGDGGDAQAQHKDGVAVNVLFQPHGQQHHVDDHTDDHAGEQRPGHLPDKLHLGLFPGVPGGEGADIATEQVEKGRPHRVVADK